MSGTTEAPATEKTMRNVYGNDIPARLVSDKLKLEDQAVLDLIGKAQAQRDALAAFKATAMADVTAFLDLLAANYGAKRSGRRGGVQLNSFDGLMRVEVSVADGHTFGPELALAKDKIGDCLSRWSDGARDELRQLVDEAFRVGKAGQVSVDRIRGLRRIKSTDEEWLVAMKMIDDALRIDASKSYIRFYVRENLDADFQQIVLDASRL